VLLDPKRTLTSIEHRTDYADIRRSCYQHPQLDPKEELRGPGVPGHFQAEDRLTFAVSDGKAYCVDNGIGLLKGMLDPKNWLRIHRCSLVNVQWIKEASPLPGGSLCLRLMDAANTELTVARDRVREFKARMAGQPKPPDRIQR
jgi:hypothetical protein